MKLVTSSSGARDLTGSVTMVLTDAFSGSPDVADFGFDGGGSVWLALVSGRSNPTAAIANPDTIRKPPNKSLMIPQAWDAAHWSHGLIVALNVDAHALVAIASDL